MNAVRYLLPSLVLGVLIVNAPAQIVPGAATVFFSPSANATSVFGGPNSTQIHTNDAIVGVVPDAFAPAASREICDLGTFSAWFGDEDSDGDYTDTIIGAIDALHLPPTAAFPPSLFDFFFSIQTDSEAAGILAATGILIDEADIIRILPRGGFVAFITKSQIESAMATTLAATSDVNAFAVDDLTGDLYFSFTATLTVNGASLLDGSVMRIPATGYVANPDGTVQSVVPGSAEIVLLESEVHAMFLSAGANGVTDLAALEIDPNGGSFVSSSTGFTVPNLWMADEDSADSSKIVSTAFGVGALATLGPVTFDGPAALGIVTGTVSVGALEFAPLPLFEYPLHLDAFPLAYTTPGTLTIDVSGGTPGPNVLLLAKLGVGSGAGSFTYRWSIFLSMLPLFDVPGGFHELYINDPTDPFTQLTFLDGTITIDPDGFGSRSYAVPTLPPGIAFAFQAVDLVTLRLSTPVIPVTL